MQVTAVRFSRRGLPSQRGFSPSSPVAWLSTECGRLPDFVALMKPRVMALAVFTALVGLLIAPGHIDPLLAVIAVLAIGAGAGAAGVLNMWYDADIDGLMARTAMRPIPRGRVSEVEALVFGLFFCRWRRRCSWICGQR
jgi:heme O synthase-like polyprenyltransferase